MIIISLLFHSTKKKKNRSAFYLDIFFNTNEFFNLLQYNPWGRGHGNPPAFDKQGRMVKPVRPTRDEDLVNNHLNKIKFNSKQCFISNSQTQ